MKLTRRILTTATAVLALAACDSLGPETPRIDMMITATTPTPSVVSVANHEVQVECTITFEAQATGTSGAVAEWRAGTRRWYMGTDHSTPVQVDELAISEVREFWGGGQLHADASATTMWKFWAPTPFLLEHEFEYTVDGDPRTASVRAGCGIAVDSMPAPPVVSDVVIALPDTLEPSDTFRVAFRASTAGRLWRSRIVINGAYEETINFIESLKPEAVHDKLMTVPYGTAPGSPITVSVLAVDALGQTSPVVSQLSAPLVDVTPPTIELMHVAEPIWPTPDLHLRGQWAVGDTIRLQVEAYDNYRIDGLTANIAGTEHVIPFTGDYWTPVGIAVRSEWPDAPSMSFTVTDRQGLTSEPYAALPDSIRLYPVSTYPTAVLAVSDTVIDLAWDDLRELAYVATNVPEVIVLATPSLTIQRRLPLPAVPSAVDVSASGDTLLLALPERGTIALIDLQSNALTELHVTPSDSFRVTRAVLLGEGTALVGLEHPYHNDLAHTRHAFMSIARISHLRHLHLRTGVPRWILD